MLSTILSGHSASFKILRENIRTFLLSKNGYPGKKKHILVKLVDCCYTKNTIYRMIISKKALLRIILKYY